MHSYTHAFSQTGTKNKSNKAEGSTLCALVNSIKYSCALTMAVYQFWAEETVTCKAKEIRQTNNKAKKKALSQRQGANMSSIRRSYLRYKHACPRQDKASSWPRDRYPHQHRRYWIHKITRNDATRADTASTSYPVSPSSSPLKLRLIRSPTTACSTLQISSQNSCQIQFKN